MNDAVLALELNQVDTSAGIISLSNHARTTLWTVTELEEWDAFRRKYLSDEPDSSAARDSYFLARSMVALLSVGGELTPQRLTDAYNRFRHETPAFVIDLVRFNGKTWDVIEGGRQALPGQSEKLNGRNSSTGFRP